VDEHDAGVGGVGRAGEVDRGAVEFDRPGVGLVDAGEDLHERGLAGPVLTDDREHLAGPQGERHAGQRDDPGEPLINPGCAEARGGHFAFPTEANWALTVAS